MSWNLALILQNLEKSIVLNPMITDLDMDSNKITNCADPVNNQDVATKNYVDSVDSEYFNSETFMTNSGAYASVLPDDGDPINPNVLIWNTADGTLTAVSGSFNYVLEPVLYNQTLDVFFTASNNSGAGTRSFGIAFQFQNASDDSWTTTELPYQNMVVEIKETSGIRLVYKLNKEHGFKAFRILVKGENATDVRFGTGVSYRANYCAAVITSFS